MSFVGKRKRYSKDIKCLFFPDDVRNSINKVGGEPSVSASSVSKSWEKCGDSFLDTPVLKKLSSVRPSARSTPARPGVGGRDEDPVQIAWSSSESEQSDGDAQPRNDPATQGPRPAGPRRPARPLASVRSYSGALRMLSTGTDELPAIDWHSERSESEDEVQKEEESVGEISDCQSESCDEPEESSKPTAVTEAEISDYSSDGESAADDTLTESRLDSPPLRPGESSRTSVSDWVRSVQASLQTPQKPTDRQAKTPEDSAKKRRKFLSGGLAERLNRLQCRQRSAISFWRHQSISDATVAAVDKPGVLELEVLSIREESGTQLALCEQRRPPRADPHGPPPSSTTSADSSRARVLALFNKDTAAQLMPAPRDVIHVYPPWQSLVMEGENSIVILNTHFSQKVFSDSGQAGGVSAPRAPPPVEKRPPYSLARSFGLLGASETPEERLGRLGRVTTPQSVSAQGGGACDSLLEAIEAWGQAGSDRGQEVEVVVQRVYSAPLQERCPAALLRPKGPCRSPSAPPPQKATSRLCALVQDGYGMFSVVQLHPLPGEDLLQLYCERWQGRTCLLRAVKVVRRVTRERCPRLFNLIDSLWPPMIAPKVHGKTHSCENEGRPEGPAPSFCYLLSGVEGSVEPVEGQGVSPLYSPPVQHTLRQILQREHRSCRCSFVASVVYKRTQSQSGDAGQSEVWLVVTDPSLQGETAGGACSRTLAVCLDTSCVLAPSVSAALANPTACLLSFRDAVLEHGVVLCVEQSVVRLTGSLEPAGSAARPEPSSQDRARPYSPPPRPLTLDPLGLGTTPNSLCSLSGVIVGVDEDTAYSWPVCNLCGSDRLEIAQQKTPEVFHCVTCDSVVNQPTTKMQLDVFVSCSSLSNCTVKVKLQQNTITAILNSAKTDNEFPGYEVENVLGKELGPIAAYVRVVTRTPALWMGLEEIFPLRLDKHEGRVKSNP